MKKSLLKRTILLSLFMVVLLLIGCKSNQAAANKELLEAINKLDSLKSEVIIKGDRTDLTEQVIALGSTTDIHGRIYAYEYATDSVDSDAGYAKIYTAIEAEKQKHPEMILIDVGDTVQDNSAELFNDLDTHPLVEAMNAMDFDVWVLGNHEFNFDKSFVDRNILRFKGAVLSANIREEHDSSHYAMPYKIFFVNGCRVAVIGIIPPHVPEWEASSPSHYKGLSFEGTLASVQDALNEIEGKYDVLVGAFHLARVDERGAKGIIDIAKAIPEFDIIFGGHEHAKYIEKVGDVTIIEPGKYGWALARADIKVKKEGDAWQVISVEAKNVETKKLEEHPEILEQFEYVHNKSVEDANVVVGSIEGEFVNGVDFITGEDKVTTMPRAQIEDTAVIDLINEVQMYYTKSEISSAALFNFGSTLHTGEFKKKDVAYIYKYPNTLVGVNITGENLKKYMEWSASYYNQIKPGDLTVSFNPKIRGYNYDMFAGVEYQIDVSKPAGERITNLTFQGKPIDNNKVYKLAVNNYRFGTIEKLGLVTKADKYYDSYETMQDAGRIRSLIVKYVQEEKNGKIIPNCDNNWKITGFTFDMDKLAVIKTKILAGTLKIPTSEDGRTLNVRSLTMADL
ncbi:MAG: 5'-nucleotidase C-terminal domain-containing protein [Spirochaetes bacterium]|nr:5'-nucleotidase C-terminal domain-containing protein [Spirochaetota bacterium]